MHTTYTKHQTDIDPEPRTRHALDISEFLDAILLQHQPLREFCCGLGLISWAYGFVVLGPIQGDYLLS